MFKYLSKIRSNPHRLMFEPGFLGLLVNPFYINRTALYRVIRLQAPSLQGKTLDIGCGSKPYEDMFSSASSYVGLDIETSGHDHKRSKVDVFYDGKTIPFDAGAFDNIVSFETFEHVFNLDDLLDEIARVLRDDGKLMFSIPFAWPEHEQPYDFGRYTSFGIADKLNARGFQIEYMRKTGDFVSAISQISIEYFRAQFIPRNMIGRLMLQLLFVAPFTILSKIAAFILPKRYEYFCNLVVVARKGGNGKEGTAQVISQSMKEPLVAGLQR